MADADVPPLGEIEPLLAEIAAEYRLTAHLTLRAAIGPAVATALATVPRHAFVPASERHFAYDNRPLAISRGQTTSQPFIVALMTNLLDPAPDHIVLEIGTGCGYQAAVLARLVRHVYSVEVIPELAAGAATVPVALIEQLKPGGRMVIPVDRRVFGQMLVLIEKDAEGRLHRRDALPVAFVPFTRP